MYNTVGILISLVWIFTYCLVFKVLTKSDLLPESTLKIEHRNIYIAPKDDDKQKNI